MPKSTFFNLPPERQQEILETAAEYYSETPFSEITLRSLTERLGMPMGTFYRYFTDKDELFLHLCQVLNDGYKWIEGFILSPPFEEVEDDCNPPHIIRFFEAFFEAPEEVQRRFYFEIFPRAGLDMHKNELMRLKYQGMLRDDVDIDLIAFLYCTVMYNLNAYFNRMNIRDKALRWHIRKYLFYNFFKYGVLRPDADAHQ